MKREFILQLVLFLIGLTSFGNDAIGQATTDISGYVFSGAKVTTNFSIVGGDPAKYVAGDGSQSTLPVQSQSDWNQASSGSVDFIKNKPQFMNLSGSGISITKTAIGTVTPNTGDGYSIDISGCGFSNVLGVSIIPVRASVTLATAAPKVAIETISTTAIVVNIIEGNPNTVNILGSLVLLGTSETFVTSFTGLTLRVIVYGN